MTGAEINEDKTFKIPTHTNLQGRDARRSLAVNANLNAK